MTPPQPDRPRLLALFAEPLVDRDGIVVPPLDADAEREDIAGWLEDTDIDLALEPGRLDDLEKTLTPAVTVLHFSGHGAVDGLLLEDALGRGHLLGKAELAGILAAYNDGNLKLAFLSACHSDDACDLVVNAGVPLVVGIVREAAVADSAARDFARVF